MTSSSVPVKIDKSMNQFCLELNPLIVSMTLEMVAAMGIFSDSVRQIGATFSPATNSPRDSYLPAIS